MKIRSVSAFPKWIFAGYVGCTGVATSILSLGFAFQACASEGATNRMVTFTDDSRTVFALSLLPNKELPAVSGSHIAIVVDTSASQSGEFRTDSLEVAQSIVEALPEDSTVSLLACDVEPVVLAKASHPSSDLLTQGFKKLEMRVPLGTTDLASAFKAARLELGDQKDGNIIYIGDGCHLSNLLSTAQFELVIDSLRETRTTVHSLAIGPKTDCELLAVFSNHTGGRVFVRQNISATCQQIGSGLAKAAIEPVFWPTTASWPSGMDFVVPAKLPPMRSDRDSILVGNMKSASVSGKATLEGTVLGQPLSMVWDVASEPSDSELAYLTQVVDKATVDSGLLLPLPGSDALSEVGLMLANSSEQLVKDARFALSEGDLDAAINIANEALKRAPNSLSAKNILESAKKSQKTSKPVKTEKGGKSSIVKFVSAQIGDDSFLDPPADETVGNGEMLEEETMPAGNNPFGDDPALGKPSMETIPPANSGSPFDSYDNPLGELGNASLLLEQDDAMRRVAAEALEREVKSQLAEARRSRDPQGTKESLKSLQGQLRRSSELNRADQVRLESQVASAIQAAARAEATQREQTARIEAVQSAQAATKRLMAETERRYATVQQLVERYNSLMAQQLFSQANSDVAPEISAIDRGSVIDVVTNLESNIAANVQLMNDVVNKRRRGFVDSLYVNELIFVPFVDEPPIRYPPADVWQALSARRLARYGSIDLSGGNPSEQKIYAALGQPGEINFKDKPLAEVMKEFATTYSIPIVIDKEALEELNLTEDEPVNLELPTVSFRSALKLILEPMQLTYVIEDEVMRITSKESSANVVRVYPVGDLVVPIMSGGGMGGMGGGMGGMGGGMGGMGGGMGGGGMGGMGGGGMGGGGMGRGGMMDVPDQPTKKSKSSPKVAADVSPAELVAKVVESNGADRLAAEAALSAWVVRKMDSARKAALTKDDKLVRQNFQEVIDTISDTMRKTLPAGWMYTALSTAMEGCEYPGTEIRRVLLSSIDFGGDADAALKIARYLAGQGLKKDALCIYRDVHQSNPMLKEPLESGLELSLELQDQDSIRWACAGILSQAWTDDQLPLIEKALIAAKAAYIRMNRNSDTMKAYAFEKEMKHAQLRDIVVRVSWTGNADIDIAVEEPTGTTCDKSNTRTSSGGLLLADGSSLDKPSKDGFSETYVCANGYAGQYKILLRRVWGEITGGTVTVNIATDYGTKDQKFFQQQIPVNQDSIVIAEVKNGHRTQPIYEAQLAKIQSHKAKAGGAVLAQAAQDGSGSNDSSSSQSGSGFDQLVAAYASSGIRPGAPGIPGGPFVGRGVVGYRPVIVSLPAGANFSASVVISGDRRYVRVTAFPSFFDIIAVDTFNTFTGGTTTGGGGGLGGGAGGGGGGGGFGGGGAF